MARTTVRKMTSGPTLSLILRFSIPLLLGNLFQQTYNLVDAAIVGQTLGANALAAVGASSSVQFLVLGFCIGACVGFAVPIAQRFGANDLPSMRQYVFGGAVWSGIVAVVMTLATSLSCSGILHLLRVPEEIFRQAYWYLVIIFLGIPFTILYNYLSSILRAIGDSKTPFIFLALSAVLNIGLDFFCILVLKWGVAGASIATVFSQAVSGILCLLLIHKRFEVLHLHKEDMTLNRQINHNLLVMGLPMGLQYSITAIGSMVMQGANNSLGTVYVSGFTAGMKIKQFMMCPFDALATAVSTFASQNYGAGEAERIRKGILEGVLVGVTYGVLSGLLLIFFGRPMSMIFMDGGNAAALNASALYLRRMGMFWWALGILNVMRMATQGLGYAGRAVFSGVFETICRMAVALIFVPMYGYDAITFTDQAAWIGASLYIIPTCLWCIRQITRKLNQPEIN